MALLKNPKRISFWAHRCLSRGMRLVLLNAMLSNILVYWDSIAKIPKGILHKIRKVCFHFLWAGISEKRSYPLVKWTKLAMPKELGRQGIKNLVWFYHALVAKIMWRLLHNDMVWGRVVSSKYISGMSFIEWIKIPTKNTQSSSICWKALVEDFRLLESI
jgi:hypothetical protein